MKNIRLWALWRRIQYGTGFSAFVLLCVFGVYYGFFYVAPACFDGVQNGGEIGVDCGGECVRICPAEILSPEIQWTESFEVASSQYNAVAYVENPNSAAGTQNLQYTFRLYDEGDQLIAERSGSSPLPPNNIYALFEGRIATYERQVARTEIDLEVEDAVWQPFTEGREQFDVGGINLVGADGEPRLSARITNTTLQEEEGVDVVATIFDSAGTPLTASRTYLDSIASRSTEEIVFTWPNPIAKTVRSCIVPSDIMLVLDRSGSMAADGGNPPEPLESAKQAAVQFVEQTRDRDQVGFLSYATTPSDPMERVLDSDKERVKNAIANTKMGTDGTQYTDMGAAFEVATAELGGSRARVDARKVIVLLTDGDVTRPVNPETGERDVDYAAQFAREKASVAKDNGITVYSIGFGDFFKDIENVLERDIQLVEDIASSEEQSFIAPTVSDLEQVYTEIAQDICEDGPTRIDVLPITGGNFVPLR